MLLREDPNVAQTLLTLAAADAVAYPEVASWALAMRWLKPGTTRQRSGRMPLPERLRYSTRRWLGPWPTQSNSSAGVPQFGRVFWACGGVKVPEAKAAFRLAAETAHDAERKVALTLSDGFCVDRHCDDFVDLVAHGRARSAAGGAPRCGPRVTHGHPSDRHGGSARRVPRARRVRSDAGLHPPGAGLG